ncbi:hypothetical protein CYMTET_26705, partial [Cymbomonas tetramitiformis]
CDVSPPRGAVETSFLVVRWRRLSSWCGGDVSPHVKRLSSCAVSVSPRGAVEASPRGADLRRLSSWYSGDVSPRVLPGGVSPRGAVETSLLVRGWEKFLAARMGDSSLRIRVVCTKVRDNKKRIVRLKEGFAQGRHVIIVDDLVQSGGTLIECQKVLAAVGARHVSAYVTHGVFPNRSFERFIPEKQRGGAASGFKHFWMTDSCPQTVREVRDRAPFEILSLDASIGACLEL